MAAFILLAAAGCSKTAQEGGKTGLACLTLPSTSLPKGVYLAPWKGGSDKVPWVTSNPFLTKDKQVISEFVEDGKIVEKGSVREVLMAAYWVGESGVEISVLAMQFTDPASASRAARALQPQIDQDAKIEPHTAQTLLHRGSVVCILGHTSAVDKDVWSAMVSLVQNALAEMP